MYLYRSFGQMFDDFNDTEIGYICMEAFTREEDFVQEDTSNYELPFAVKFFIWTIGLSFIIGIIFA